MKLTKKSNTLAHLIRAGLAGVAIASFLHSGVALAQNEPPGRVGRIGYSYGQISFADAGSTQWTELLPNRPISIGDSVFVGDQSRAELQVGNSTVRMNENTRLSFINLTDDVTQIQLTQGTVIVRVRALSEREVFELSTPNFNFAIQEPGEYRININYDNTTTIIVRRGVGVAQGDRDVITLREGEQTRFSGTNLNHSTIARAPGFDTFDQWAVDRNRAEENSVSARYVPRDMVGYQQLDEYGRWETHAEYGAVWYPNGVSVGWAPYRDGRWVWVAPWGWTWVDRSPWGFAPYHYGRWAYIGNRWAWCPGRYERHHRPIYAPALVAFVGASNHGVKIGVTVGGRHSVGPAVSWYPLGPGESYRPHYTQSPRYIQNINQTIINNTVVVNRNRDVYVNRHVPNAVTSVPQNTFVRGEHVFPATKSILSSQVKQLQVLSEGPNLQPERQNRFGDGRPRTWQENDQYRSRAVATPNTLNEPNQANDLRHREQNPSGTGQNWNNNSSNANTRPNSGNNGSTPAPLNYVNPVERNANGSVNQYPQRPERMDSSNAPPNLANNQVNNQVNNQTMNQPRAIDDNPTDRARANRLDDNGRYNRTDTRRESNTNPAASLNTSPNYNPPIERSSNGTVMQYPQRPERNDVSPAIANPSNSQPRSYDEMQAERGRNNRFDESNRLNRPEPRREPMNVPQPSITSSPINTAPTPVPAPSRAIERNMERNERLIERGNDRPIERPQASFAQQPEPVRAAAPVSIPAPVAPSPRVERVDRNEKAKEKNDDGRQKRNER